MQSFYPIKKKKKKKVFQKCFEWVNHLSASTQSAGSPPQVALIDWLADSVTQEPHARGWPRLCNTIATAAATQASHECLWIFSVTVSTSSRKAKRQAIPCQWQPKPRGAHSSRTTPARMLSPLLVTLFNHKMQYARKVFLNPILGVWDYLWETTVFYAEW